MNLLISVMISALVGLIVGHFSTLWWGIAAYVITMLCYWSFVAGLGEAFFEAVDFD